MRRIQPSRHTALRAFLPAPLFLILAFHSCTPVITELIPASGRVKVGDALTVVGTNFGFSAGSLRVYVDGVRVADFKPGSSDTRLVFDIPLSIDVPPQGKSAILTVSNGSASVQRILLLQPAVVPTGSVEVIALRGSPAVIQPGQQFTFPFSMRSHANMVATIALTAWVNVDSRQEEWQQGLQILDSNNRPMAAPQITVAAGQSILFSVRINVPSGTTAGTQFSVQVNASPGGITGSSAAVPETVGQMSNPM